MTTERQPTTLADILASGYLAGYEHGPPPTIRPENEAIDRAVCQECTCDHCGHHGLRYRAFHNDRSYICFTVCPRCFSAEEF